jgi:hypothetical protein
MGLTSLFQHNMKCLLLIYPPQLMLHTTLNFKSLASCLLATLLFFGAGHAHAQSDKSALIQRIAEAQGLLELIDQQLVQQREVTRAGALKMFEDSVRQVGGEPSDRERQAFERLVSRSSNMFSAKELVAVWVAEYGKDLSVQELNAMLKYYLSPIGRKDVAASKMGMVMFSKWMAEQAQQRTADLISTFASELKAAQQ